MSRPEALITHLAVDQVNAAMQENMARQITWSSKITIVFTPAMIAEDRPAIVIHDLNQPPTDISITPWQGATWWVDQNDRKLWNAKTVAFHASADGRYDVRAGIR